jgi:hypothetical protein
MQKSDRVKKWDRMMCDQAKDMQPALLWRRAVCLNHQNFAITDGTKEIFNLHDLLNCTIQFIE